MVQMTAANNGNGCMPRGLNGLDLSSSSSYKEVLNVLESNTKSQIASNVVEPTKQERVSQDIKHLDWCDPVIEDCRVTLKARKAPTMHEGTYRCNRKKETIMTESKKKKRIENGRILKLEEESTLLERRVTSIEQELRILRKVARLLKYDEPIDLLESESSCNYLHVHS